MDAAPRESSGRSTLPTPLQYGTWVVEKTRNMDTDQFGHVNHAAMATLFEGARVELIFAPEVAVETEHHDLLIAKLTMNFHRELAAPGTIRNGSAVRRIGSSSLDIDQAIFDGDSCIASSLSVCVLIDHGTRKPSRVSERLRSHLMR